MSRKYSVLMSVYKQENPSWLSYAIQSILEQTVAPDEFVIIKDGPLTDDLNKTINSFREEYPKLFKIIQLRQNQGLGLALKRGIVECRNEYIARIDSDDYATPTRIEEQFNVFEHNPELDIVGSNVNEFQDDISNVIAKVVLPQDHSKICKFSKRRCPFRHPSLLYKKSAVLRAGNYRSYYLCEDYDLYIRMLKTGSLGYNIQEPLTYMRINENFYKRRGGLKYLKSIIHFKNEQLKTGYFSPREYIISTAPHIVVCLLPNKIRDIIYRKMLRK